MRARIAVSLSTHFLAGLLLTMLCAPGSHAQTSSVETAAPDTVLSATAGELTTETLLPPQTRNDPGWGEMTPERRAQAIAYSDTKNILYFVTTLYGFLIMVLFLSTHLSARLRSWAERVGKRRFFAWALYLLAFSVLLLVVNFPFAYYSGFALEHKYDLSNQAFGDWFLDLLKGEGIGYLVLLPLVWLLYVAIRRSPKRWWLWAGAFTAPVAAFFLVVAPVVIAPMFNKFTPLQDEALKTKILNMATEAGISDSRVFQVDASKQSKKYNAYVTGLFGSKRIVLYDTILEDMGEEEILFVMAQEIGHYVMHHIWLGVASMTLFVLVASFLIARISAGLIARFQGRWGVSALSDFASFPLIILLFSLFGFISQPLFAGMSRYFEHKSDEFGLAMAPNRAAAASAFEKLAAKNLSNPEPSAFIEFWLYDHPTIKKRVEYVLGEQEG